MDTSKFYEATFRPPTCAVDKKLLEELEEFFERKDKEYCPDDPKPFADRYFLRIHDADGVEQCSTVKAYNPVRFPNDAKRILVSYSWLHGGPFKVELVFTPHRSSSEIRIYFCGDNARHTVHGTRAELVQLLSAHETGFGYAHLSGWGVIAVLCLSSGIAGVSATMMVLGRGAYWVVGCALGLIGGFYSIVLPELRPYSKFDNPKNERRERWAFWAISSTIAFVVFGVLGVIFRKRLLGY